VKLALQMRWPATATGHFTGGGLAEFVLAAAYAVVVRRDRRLQPQGAAADRIGELR
jgi:hypothetical protein